MACEYCGCDCCDYDDFDPTPIPLPAEGTVERLQFDFFAKQIVERLNRDSILFDRIMK